MFCRLGWGILDPTFLGTAIRSSYPIVETHLVRKGSYALRIFITLGSLERRKMVKFRVVVAGILGGLVLFCWISIAHLATPLGILRNGNAPLRPLQKLQIAPARNLRHDPLRTDIM